MTAFRRPSGLMAFAAALALLARLLVPAGFMPAANGPALILCTGQGAVAVDKHLPATPASHDGDCAFSAAAAPGTAPDALAFTAPPAPPAAIAAAIPATARFGEGLGHPPLPSTGPPALS